MLGKRNGFLFLKLNNRYGTSVYLLPCSVFASLMQTIIHISYDASTQSLNDIDILVTTSLCSAVPEVSASCTFPEEYKGTWQGTGRGEPRVYINGTHLVTALYRGAREVRVVHVCVQNRGKRYLISAQPENGW